MQYKWQALVTVGVGSYLATMDTSIVNIAMPSLAQVFHTSPNTALWVSLAYVLTTTGLTLTIGRLGDLLGRKRIYVTGFAIFTVGLALAAAAQSLPQLIAARIFQAIGAASIMANGTAIITAVFPPHERGRAIGVNSAVVGAGLMSGPLIGGLLLDTAGWRAIFWLRIPIGLAALATSWVVLRHSRPKVTNRRLDVPGAVALFVALTALLVAVNRGQTWGWTSPPIVVLAVIGLAALIAFLWIESHTDSPIVVLSLFRERLLAASVLSLMLSFVAQASVSFLLPFYLSRVLGFSALETGLTMISVPVLMLLASPFAGLLSDRFGPHLLATAGVVLTTAALFWLSTLEGDTSTALVIARLLLLGAGGALFQAPNSSAIMGMMPRSMLGTGAATIATARNIGTSSGLALAGAVFVAAAAGRPGDAITSFAPEAVLTGIRAALLTAAIISLTAVAASLMRGVPGRQPSEGERPPDVPAPSVRERQA